jgi:hypothetical protein
MIKIMNQKITIVGIILMILLISLTVIAQENSDYLITNKSVGKIKLGMTVAEAKKAMTGATFSRSSDGDGVALIDVSSGGGTSMSLYAGEEDPEAKINEKARIEFIEVWDSKFKTAEGVHVKMKMCAVESKYGEIKSIFMSEIESREFAEFTNNPKGLQFRLTAPNIDSAGIYPEGKRETTVYASSSYIMSISISSPPKTEE